jgi:hypothetical protein
MIHIFVGVLLFWVGILIEGAESSKARKTDYTMPPNRTAYAVSTGFMYAAIAVLLIGTIAMVTSRIG